MENHFVVEIEGLSKSFDDDHVLTDINLNIKSGEFLTLLGPSGCGKSTLLRLISGFEEPTEGIIKIHGNDVSGVGPEDRHVNMVFQHYALFPHMTVFDNIAFGLRCKRLPLDEINYRVEEMLKIVRLTSLKNRKPDQLSGGQQQRVAMARAAVNEPLVLLLDEPLSALDYSLRQEMQLELKTLQRKLGITFVLVTHDQEEALSISDRVVVMNEGVIEQIGTPREVYEKPRNLYVANFIGRANEFPATVLKADEKQVIVEIEGIKFELQNRKGFVTGDEVHVVVRPEDLRAWDMTEVDASEKKEMLRAQVEQVIYKGSTVDLMLRTEGGRLLAATEFFDEDDEDLDYRKGEKVWVEWMAGWEVILPHDE